jgi:hypothetical protein
MRELPMKRAKLALSTETRSCGVYGGGVAVVGNRLLGTGQNAGNFCGEFLAGGELNEDVAE